MEERFDPRGKEGMNTEEEKRAEIWKCKRDWKKNYAEQEKEWESERVSTIQNMRINKSNMLKRKCILFSTLSPVWPIRTADSVANDSAGALMQTRRKNESATDRPTDWTEVVEKRRRTHRRTDLFKWIGQKLMKIQMLKKRQKRKRNDYTEEKKRA